MFKDFIRLRLIPRVRDYAILLQILMVFVECDARLPYPSSAMRNV